MTHTPGPWRVVPCETRGYSVHIGTHDTLVVGESGGPSPMTVEDEANARLIAASPDQYRELVSSTNLLISLWNDLGDKHPRAEQIQQQITHNQAAIAKAKLPAQGQVPAQEAPAQGKVTKTAEPRINENAPKVTEGICAQEAHDRAPTDPKGDGQ